MMRWPTSKQNLKFNQFRKLTMKTSYDTETRAIHLLLPRDLVSSLDAYRNRYIASLPAIDDAPKLTWSVRWRVWHACKPVKNARTTTIMRFPYHHHAMRLRSSYNDSIFRYAEILHRHWLRHCFIKVSIVFFNETNARSCNLWNFVNRRSRF